ncbi:reverse transcriptase domain-containing protein [Ensifer sp.]|uniref:reverse transcriptase domain-containing protein n=1 Tax=Ensifer sp. TaxID=1872086 RepID=UPI0028973362|nr:reverse transcriptase domain-containing protein [Ensifer sp.]
MQNAIKQEIKRLAQKAFLQQAREVKSEDKYRRQFEKRTGINAGIPTVRPGLSKPRHFDPKYCSRNANFLAKTIWYKVLQGTYEPSPAINYQIPKPDGTKRSIMAFSIPDAALANVVLRRARGRNTKRLSPSSYAYHPDKNVFDAILALKEYDHDGKLFSVQIDFEKYFDNIPAWYLEKKIDDESQISLTPHERYIFKTFIHHKYSAHGNCFTGPFERRQKGTPQGSSVSLLLANLSNHDLDVKLAASSGRFVRFADDVVALCSGYNEAQELERCFVSHCRTSGLILNAKKSPGIAVISHSQQELRTYPYFDYLGYRFGPAGLTMPQKTVERIKSRASRLINLYLIHYLDVGYNRSRANVAPLSYDWDLLGLIYELRRSLYGGLAEADLDGFIHKGTRLPRMKGIMGFYCLLDDPAPLLAIDGWLLSVVRRAMKKRNQILTVNYGSQCPTPSNKELATGAWLNLAAWRGGDVPEPRMPSLVRGWRAARKHFFTFGLEYVQAPNYGFYTDFEDLFDY